MRQEIKADYGVELENLLNPIKVPSHPFQSLGFRGPWLCSARRSNSSSSRTSSTLSRSSSAQV